MDEITIEILEDGTLRITTDKIGDVNHINAESLLKFIKERMGGKVDIQKRKEEHYHVHNHIKHTH